VSRSFLTVFWTPATRRFSRTRSMNRLASPPGAGSGGGASPAGCSMRWGERLSTVKGPLTRTILGSVYGWS